MIMGEKEAGKRVPGSGPSLEVKKAQPFFAWNSCMKSTSAETPAYGMAL